MQPSRPLAISRDEITSDSDLTVAQQIAAAFRDRIAARKLRTGDTIPSERTLARQLGFTRGTIARAYDILAEDGLLARRPRESAQVRVPPPVRRLDDQRFAAELRRVREGTLDPDLNQFCLDYGVSWPEYTVDTEFRRMPATEEVRQLLLFTFTRDVLQRRMVRKARGVPTEIHWSWMLAATVDNTPVADPDEQPWRGGTIAELWHLGFAPTRIYQTARFRPATPWEAAALILPAGHPMLEITRRFVDDDRVPDGRPVEVSRVVTSAAGSSLEWITHII